MTCFQAKSCFMNPWLLGLEAQALLSRNRGGMSPLPLPRYSSELHMKWGLPGASTLQSEWDSQKYIWKGMSKFPSVPGKQYLLPAGGRLELKEKQTGPEEIVQWIKCWPYMQLIWIWTPTSHMAPHLWAQSQEANYRHTINKSLQICFAFGAISGGIQSFLLISLLAVLWGPCVGPGIQPGQSKHPTGCYYYFYGSSLWFFLIVQELL